MVVFQSMFSLHGLSLATGTHAHARKIVHNFYAAFNVYTFWSKVN